MVPLSLAHRIIETHAPVRDVWRIIHPESSHGAAKDKAEMLRGLPMPNAEFNLSTNGTTCDSAFNSWRWNEAHKKRLKKGENVQIDPAVDDPHAKRLDYVFFGSPQYHNTNTGEDVTEWELKEANVGMTMRHPTLHCSLSDHFSVECTLTRRPDSQTAQPSNAASRYLPKETYEEIMATLVKYMDRQRLQRKLRISHFFFQLSVWTACMIGVWWSPHNYVSFILMLLSSIGLSVGVIDGLMGLLFGGSEMRALKEFEWEVKNAMDRASDAESRKAAA